MMKKKLTLAMLICAAAGLILTSCGQPKDDTRHTLGRSIRSEESLHQPPAFISAEGTTLETRIRVPEGYTRVPAKSGSLTAFLRVYPMKEDGSPVLLYNGTEKRNQSAHAAVFRLPLEKYDLQQCADSVMRVYAEYFHSTKQDKRIRFHFVDGFLCDYNTWKKGGRVSFRGDTARWTYSAKKSNSYKSFVSYLRTVFAYASTLSLEEESSPTNLTHLQSGDIFLKAGSPGHVVMVVDICEKNGKKAFLLAQGYTPAQEFELLKNPKHRDDPWYYEDEISYPLRTPEYTFPKGSLRHLNY